MHIHAWKAPSESSSLMHVQWAHCFYPLTKYDLKNAQFLLLSHLNLFTCVSRFEYQCSLTVMVI